MPQYDYKCQECQQAFSIFCGMNDNRDNIKCEHCNSSDVYRIYNGIITKTKGVMADSSSHSATSSACGSCSGGSCSGCH